MRVIVISYQVAVLYVVLWLLQETSNNDENYFVLLPPGWLKFKWLEYFGVIFRLLKYRFRFIFCNNLHKKRRNDYVIIQGPEWFISRKMCKFDSNLRPILDPFCPIKRQMFDEAVEIIEKYTKTRKMFSCFVYDDA